MSNKDLLRQPEAITPSFLITKRRYGVRKGGVTLIEILIVIIIIGILVTLALPNFGTMRERALDKEAKANLKLIQAAQRIYRMENQSYYPYGCATPPCTESDISDINSDLRLFLTENNWDYAMTGGGFLSVRGRRASPPLNWDRFFKIGVGVTGYPEDEACCCPCVDAANQCLSQDTCTSCPALGSCP